MIIHALSVRYVIERGIIRAISENWEKYALVDLNLLQCEGRFGQMTVYAAVLDYDDLT